MHKSMTLAFGLLMAITSFQQPAWAVDTLGASLKGQLKIIRSGLRYLKDSGEYEVRLSVVNASQPKTTLYGPLALELTSISRSNLSLQNASGINENGKPYIRVQPVNTTLEPRSSIKNIVLRFSAATKKSFSFTLTPYGYLSANNTPVIEAAGTLQIQAGALLEFSPTVSDADNDSLMFTLTQAPAGMQIDQYTGAVSWTPDASQTGEQSFTISVNDPRGGIATQSFAVQVAGASVISALLAPSGLQAVYANAQVNLGWNAASDNAAVTGYQVFRDGVAIGHSSTTDFIDNTILPGQTYRYTVVSSDAVGNLSPSSNEAIITINNPSVSSLTAPRNLTATKNASGVTISWEYDGNTDNIDIFEIYRDDVNLGWILPCSILGKNWSDSGVSGKHSYRVVAVDYAGNRAYSDYLYIDAR